MSNDRKDAPVVRSSSGEIANFLEQVAAAPRRTGGERGRLIFAIDATASREPAWDTACQIQGDMFTETARLGGLSVQLCYYRGFREFKASGWVDDSSRLVPLMTSVRCLGGHTQIERVLRHVVRENREKPVNAVVFVGDCVEEDADRLCNLAGELRLLGVPLFIFHEGNDTYAASTFKQMAALSGGACCRFDSASAEELRALLSAVAVYAAGGRHALEDFGARSGAVIRQLTRQLDR